jgi:hypothetical protein
MLFGSGGVLEVGIGLIFTFLVVSLITGAIIEGITSLVGWRANTLKSGVQSLLNDPNFTGLARQLYAHAAINPRGTPTTPEAGKPSYIEKAQFAGALMDILGLSSVVAAAPQAPAATAGPPALTTPLTDAVNTSIGPAAAAVPGAAGANPQIAQLINGIIERNLGDPAKVKAEIESWFDNAMDRLSGHYKRWMQFLSFVIALLLAIVLNVDSIIIAKAVWQQPILVEHLKPPAGAPAGPSAPAGPAAAAAALTTLDSYLPIGWPNGLFVTTDEKGEPLAQIGKRGWLLAAFGWLITAIATLFGAPFWFDALQKVTRLKGAGPSPDEKKTREAAAT